MATGPARSTVAALTFTAPAAPTSPPLSFHAASGSNYPNPPAALAGPASSAAPKCHAPNGPGTPPSPLRAPYAAVAAAAIPSAAPIASMAAATVGCTPPATLLPYRRRLGDHARPARGSSPTAPPSTSGVPDELPTADWLEAARNAANPVETWGLPVCSPPSRPPEEVEWINPTPVETWGLATIGAEDTDQQPLKDQRDQQVQLEQQHQLQHEMAWYDPVPVVEEWGYASSNFTPTWLTSPLSPAQDKVPGPPHHPEGGGRATRDARVPRPATVARCESPPVPQPHEEPPGMIAGGRWIV
ncbi:hypothetical protein HK405_015296, partial [Cladochytrium tenue]